MKSRKSISGEKKYYLSDLSFFFALNTDNRINYGPVLENIIYFYAKVQVAYTIVSSKETEDREFRPLEQIRDNFPKYVLTTDYLLQKRNGILHMNLMDFMKSESLFG